MSNLQKNLVGQLFGRLWVLKRVPNKNKRIYYLCRCTCKKGTLGIKEERNLTSERVKSCGCLAIEKSTTHGLTKHPLYMKWVDMIRRCYDPRQKYYFHYGGRGIKVCDEWKENFIDFYGWAMANGWKKGLSIDRFPDNNGDYEPNNCRFATPLQQRRNIRTNYIIVINGESLCMSEAVEKYSLVSYETVCKRKQNGWNDLDAIFMPKQFKKRASLYVK